ncbi:hypothetical protein N7495_009567 [Penicillium taxi]|uniref:uncharacterized protein n=1 Tax=Penicillium taxi TaxID=168475 RepID=UPI002544D67D|nr:uncharacterized protein N7495_009567 [Penicillium taxi]KAJ5885057.1 hypothetical protein N7495_009567 [Penicillium taxi]
MQEIVKYYLPETELTPENLRSIASNCKKATHDLPVSPISISPAVPPSAGTSRIPDDCLEYFEISSLHVPNMIASTDTERAILQDISHLHQKLGCLLTDSQGQCRYMGSESGVSFNAAIKCFKNDGLNTPPIPDLIPGMVTVRMPLANQKPGQRDIPLPIQSACQRLIMRYFEEVHCLYWLYSSERFYNQLEETYRTPQKNQTASWKCSLYSILSIATLGSSYPENLHEVVAPAEYLEYAKSFLAGVCDEASLDSVRAMVLLATAMQSQGFSNTAYLYTSLAVQIATSLGLHCDKYTTSHGRVEKEHARRIWWSLVVFEQDISLRLGKPCATEDSFYPPLPSEAILPSGPYSPPDYLQSCSKLSQIAKTARKHIYKNPLMLGLKLEINTVQDIMASLTEWENTLTPHLRLSVMAAPLYRRPISILHLRYHSTRILVGRPFLLYQLVCRKKQKELPELNSLEFFTIACVVSAEQMLDILQGMVSEDLHSKLIALDFFYALDILQVFLALFALTKAEKEFNNVCKCLQVLQAMGTTGFGEMMISEVLFELMEWGLFPDHSDPRHSLQDLNASLSGLDAMSEFYDRVFGSDILLNQTSGTIFSQLDIPSDLPSEEEMGDILYASV